MIRADAIPADPPGAITGEPAALVQFGGLASRMLLAGLLAGSAALIPGAAPRVLEGPLTWADILSGVRKRSALH